MTDDRWGESVNPGWVDIQKRTFTRWCNNHLIERMLKINNLETDLSSGVILTNLLEEISGKQVGVLNKNPRVVQQKLENNSVALKFLRDEGIKLVAIGPEDIVDGKLKLILGLIWTIILRYQIQKISVPGSSAKGELLAWVRKQIPEYDIQNFTSDWRDGRAICALAESLKPGIVDLSSMPRKSPLENARTGTEAAESEMGIPPVLAPEDMVSPDSDELSVMTYISYFRDYEANLAKRKEDEAKARIADPLKCTASGPGLEHADVGYDAVFTIQARNAAGKNISVGGENFDVQIRGPPNGPPVHPTIRDNNDGTYTVTYVAKVPGRHNIGVQLHNKNISGSPWTVNADKVPIDAHYTKVYGPGIEKAHTKEIAKFTIEARNTKGDPVHSGGDKFDVKVNGPYDTDVRAEVIDNKDGTYSVSYRPTEVGPHEVVVTHQGAHVANSPYNVPVETPLTEPWGDASNAYGPGLEPGNIEGEPARFTIQARNRKGEALKNGGALFDVDVIGPNDVLAEARVVDNRDGTYGVTYVAPTTGKYRVDVVLRGETPLYYSHIHQSPFSVDIEPSTDASKSLVFGDGVGDNVSNTKPTSFTIQARDKHGKNLDKGGDNFEVHVTDPSGKDLHAPLIDNGDGTYTVPYEPTNSGRHRVDVRLKGKPVGNCPITVNVKEGADWANTGIESYSFVIRTRTKAGKDKKEGGESANFKVTVANERGEEVKGLNLKDIGDGTYVVTYGIPRPGDYTVGVQLNDHHIKGSPWKQTHSN